MRDRAISSKLFSTHRVSKKCTLGNFQKIFPSPKMAAILNFRIFIKNGKTQICFYLLNRAIERFRRNFRPTEYVRNVIFAIFKKIFPSPKMAAILNFRIFAKNGKTQICFYLLNISSKLSTHRVSDLCILGNFQKIFPSPKMAAISNFRIFAQNDKTQICFYLLNRAR